jgi:hypothetical protein
MKKTSIFILIFITGYILVQQFISIEIDSCDIKCDNCMNLDQCEKCYNECYKEELNN